MLNEPPARVDDQGDDLVAAVRAEFDVVLPHLLGAIKRNEAFDSLARRLDKAEKRLAEREQRPLIAGLVRVLHQVRRLDMGDGTRELLLHQLEGVLVGAGYTEFGEVGEPFDVTRHEPLSGEATDGKAVVTEVYELGLETLGEIVVKARVGVGPPEEEREEAA